MKKIILALALASSVHAGDWNKSITATANVGGNIDEKASYVIGWDSTNSVYRVVKLNGDGSIATSGGSSTVTGNVSITASVPLTVTSSIVSNTSSYAPLSTSAYSVLSQTATVINLTNVAGVSAPCLICMTSNGGAAAGFKVQFGSSSTAPANLTASSVGHYIAASTTSQCWGPFQAGTHAYLAGVAASSSVIVDVQQAK